MSERIHDFKRDSTLKHNEFRPCAPFTPGRRALYPLQTQSSLRPQACTGDAAMAAIIALGLAFGIFALLNLIDYKRLD